MHLEPTEAWHLLHICAALIAIFLLAVHLIKLAVHLIKLKKNVPLFYFWLGAIAVLGGAAAFFLPIAINSGFAKDDDGSALRQALLYTTGGLLAVITLGETHRKNNQEKKKNENDYIRQVHAERRSRYTTAVEQLANEKAAVRLGGIYTLVGLVDEWLTDDNLHKDKQKEEGQVIINNLCSYIRTPFLVAEKLDAYEARKDLNVLEGYEAVFSPEEGSPQLQALHKRVIDSSKYKEPEDIAAAYAEHREEQDVRRAIFAEMSKRIKVSQDEVSVISSVWSDFDFDFSRALIFYPLNNLTIGKAIFSSARFYGEADFRDTEFTKDANFRDAKFTENAHFKNAKFTGYTDFTDAKFTVNADFEGAEFTGNADFTGTANFKDAKLTGYVDFTDAKFTVNANFTDAKFTGYTVFKGAEFTGNADFTGTANFTDAKFTGYTVFEGAEFTVNANFTDAKFTRGTEFTGDANFENAKFTEDANFENAKFTGNVDFGSAEFSEKADFGGAEFSGDADFNDSFFKKYAPIFAYDSGSARFSDQVNWTESNFSVRSESKPIELGSATLGDKTFSVPFGTVVFDPGSWDEKTKEYTHMSVTCCRIQRSPQHQE